MALGFSLLGPGSKGYSPAGSDGSASSSDSEDHEDAVTAASKRVASVPQGLLRSSMRR